MPDHPALRPPDTAAGTKEPFDIVEVFRRLRAVCARLPKAAMFQLRDEGYHTPYEQLVASLVSARTLDETTIPVCRRLFAHARTPAAMVALDEAELVALLRAGPRSRSRRRATSWPSPAPFWSATAARFRTHRTG